MTTSGRFFETWAPQIWIWGAHTFWGAHTVKYEGLTDYLRGSPSEGLAVSEGLTVKCEGSLPNVRARTYLRGSHLSEGLTPIWGAHRHLTEGLAANQVRGSHSTKRDKARQGQGKARAKQGKDKARQGKARQEQARARKGKGETSQDKGKTRQGKTRERQAKTRVRQDKTRQDKTRQDKTRQDKTRQEDKARKRTTMTEEHNTIPCYTTPHTLHRTIIRMCVCFCVCVCGAYKWTKKYKKKKKNVKKRASQCKPLILF